MKSYQKNLIRYLSGFITDNRLSTLESVLANRTRYLTVVLEDIYQPHNASAVLRSCDCFGIQDIHIIENRNEYRVNPDVTLGSNQWLDLYFYNDADFNSPNAIHSLKQNGYRIIATTPEADKGSLSDLDILSGKCALLFGTELTGLTEEAKSLSDEFISIPMLGFTESFNISVSVAIILYELRTGINSSSVNWQLSESEYLDLKLRWLKNSIKKSDLLEKDFRKKYFS